MSSARLVAAGIVAGFTLTAALLGAAIVAGPGPTAPAAASPMAPQLADVTPMPSPAASPVRSPDVPAGPAPFGVGEPPPGLLVPQLGGGYVDLAALVGRPVWIVFTATWCPSCRDDASAMTSFAARYRESGLVVIGVHVREDETTVAAFAQRAATDYPIALDSDGAAARRWGVLALPTHIFVDGTGIVRAGAVGTIGRDVLASSLMTIMAGTTVEP